MTIAITTFGISFAFLWAMIANRIREVRGGIPVVSFKFSFDRKLRKYARLTGIIATELPKHMGREAMHFAIKKSVDILRKVRGKVYPRIAHIVETVKGKDLPKNKGSVSLFMKAVKEHKDSL